MSVSLDRAGLVVPTGPDATARDGGRVVPLLSASVHYWRLAPARWRAAITAVKSMGFHFVDTYIPWSVHEQSDGQFDFGAAKPELDIQLFFRIIREEGLLAIARPGPHINAELSTFGIPDRVIWDADCQARGPDGGPVVLPGLPSMFPVPSYASEAFLVEVARFFAALGPVLAPCCAPDGPVALLQIDNEGAFYFRDGVYDQDYHPDAVARFRKLVGDDEAAPPTELSVGEDGLARHMEWAAFQERLIAEGIGKFAAALFAAGVPRLPTMHNFPMAEAACPLDPELIGDVVDLVGLDYYHRATPSDRRAIARRTSGLAVRCDGKKHPAFAPEMGVGFPPYFPPLSEDDSMFALLSALAYGLRGYNLYMAVERDRWIGAPVGQRGQLRPLAAQYEKINAALTRVNWVHLRRLTPVRIVIPRAERRLARVLHGFGPVSGALLSVFGLGPREAALELDVGLDVTPCVDSHTLLGALEQALDARGVPHAVVGGEEPDLALQHAEWVIVLGSGGFSDALAHALERAVASGTEVTIGPTLRRFDGEMRPLVAPWEAPVEIMLRTDPTTVDEVVTQHVEGMRGPRVSCSPDGVFGTIHHDADGEPRVAFVINTNDNDLVARMAVGPGLEGDDLDWQDVLDDETVRSDQGVIELRVRPRSVRMLARVS